MNKTMDAVKGLGMFLFAVALAGCAVSPEDARPFTVETPETAKAWERTAARELEDYLGQVAADGKVVVEGKDGVVFHVGDTAFARERGLAADSLQDEEWCIRSFGRDVVLVGGGTRGTLYAVYRFLEDECGVRWWADGEEDVPAAKPLAFGRLDRRGKPKFLYRDIYRADTSDPKTAVRNRVNGNGVSWIPPEFGGGFVFGPPYHCHTWDRYLPFAKYGKEHPEWYSLDKAGKRVGGQTAGQLCLACPGLPEVLADRIEEYIAKGEKESAAKGLPAPRMYDMSMNDNPHYCACEACKASQKRHGVSGDQLIFENKVAGILAKRHPDLLFSVFAYFAGEAVPSNGVRAADNILVKICNTKQNMAAGIFEPCNRFMHDQVAAWKGYAKNLFVWDYSITFDRNTHGFPFASEFHLGERIRYYSDNGVVGMLIEHERPATNDFYELKYWVQAKALEDPSRDPEALVVEFMDGYYGAAGRKILELRRGLDRIRRERDAFLTWFPRVSEWTFYTVEDLERAERLWDEAEALVRDDPKRLKRVRRSRIGTTRLKDLLVKLARCRHAPEPGVSDRPFVDCTPESGAYVPHDSRFTVVDDPSASTGKAIRMPVSASPKLHSMPFQLGIYCPQEAKSYASKGWSKPLGEGYQWYDLGEVMMPEKPYYVYFTRSWLVQVAPGLPELQGVRCRVKARVRFAEDAIFIDRTAFIPAASEPDVRIFRGDARHAYRDPAVVWDAGTFHLFFTLVETEANGSVFSYTAQSESTDLSDWTPPRKLTPRDGSKDYSSPGNVVKDGDEWVLCLQTYPRPGNRDDGTVRYGNDAARLFTMRSRDLRNWSAPELLRVKGPDVPEAEMGRMIDPYLLRDREGTWWCFYKQNGASISKSRDLRTWTPAGRTEAGENVCVLDAGDRYVMFHSPANGIGMKTSTDLVHWTDEPGLVTLGQKDWPWARGRLTAGAVIDARKIPGVGGYLMFFHGSGPRTEREGDFDRNASIGLVASDDLRDWRPFARSMK